MKITITLPDEIYKKLEYDRGMIPRSTWVQKLIATSIRAPKDMEKMYGVSVVDVIDRKEVKPKGEKLDKLVRDGVVKRGVKGLPSQEVEGFKTYFKNKGK